MGKGQYYLGNLNRTKSGIPCQRWDSQEPHDHIQPPLVFPQIMDGENYCRNAGGEESFPWCYTVDKTVRWQHCDIPLCGKTYKLVFISMLQAVNNFSKLIGL